MKINIERVKKRILELSEISRSPNKGATRLAFTEEDRRARDLFIRWVKDCRLEVMIDPVSNILCRYPGKDPQLPVIALGSHLDTVPEND